jgi:hypothetical protein
VGRRALLVVDVLLVTLVAFLGVRLYGAWTAQPVTVPPAPAAGAGAESAPPAAPPAAAAPPLSVYAIVAERNLFSPTRSEAAAEPPRPATAGPLPPPPPKPRLYGVVLLPDGRARAYLEDPQRRRVFAYSVGDSVGDARLEQIDPDRVVLRRGAERLEILLHDPTKPRSSPAPSAVQSPGAGGPGRPGMRPPPVPVQPPGTPPRGIVRPRPPGGASEVPGPEAGEANVEDE